MHGAGQVAKGVLVEWPMTVYDGAVNGPPVVGPLVGILGGAARALQVTAAGLVEMAEGFHPFDDRPLNKRRR